VVSLSGGLGVRRRARGLCPALLPNRGRPA